MNSVCSFPIVMSEPQQASGQIRTGLNIFGLHVKHFMFIFDAFNLSVLDFRFYLISTHSFYISSWVQKINTHPYTCFVFFTQISSCLYASVGFLPAHLVLALRGGPGAPVPPSSGLVSKTLISYSVSGSRWPILCVVLSTGCRSYMVPDTVRYSTCLSMIGPSPLMEFAFSWIQR